MVSKQEAAAEVHLYPGLSGCRSAGEPCGFPPEQCPLEVSRAGWQDRSFCRQV